MLAALAFLLAAPVQHEPRAPADDILHEVVTLELESGDRHLAGSGPSASVERTCDFTGTLSVWARVAASGSVLRVESGTGELLAEDDGSAELRPACARLHVERGEALRVVVAARDPGGAKSLELHLVSAPESDDTLRASRSARNELGRIDSLVGSGREDEARAALQRALHEMLATPGARHSAAVADAAWVLGQRAFDLEALPPAREGLTAALEHRRHVLPPEHPDVLIAMGDLALVRHHLGDVAGASELEERLHAIRERTLPPDHEHLLTARHNLALTRLELGDVPGACELFAQVLEAWESSRAPTDPDLLGLKSNFAVARRWNGDVEGALELVEEVHTARAASLSPDDPVLLSTKTNLAHLLFDQGDHGAALALYEEVRARLLETRSAEDPEVLDVQLSIAAVCATLGDEQGALASLRDILATQEARLEPEDPGLLDVRSRLASLLIAVGELAAAQEHYEAVLEVQARSLPADDPDLLRNRQALAHVHQLQGRLAVARSILQEVHAAWERRDDADPLLGMDAKLGLATVLVQIGDLEGARVLQEEVCEITAAVLSPEHVDRVSARFLLGGTLYHLGEIQEAHDVFEEVLALRERTCRPDDVALLAARANLAVAKSELGDLEGARLLLEQAVAALEQSLPPDHADVIGSRLNLAEIRRETGDLEGARELEAESLAVLREMRPPGHPELLRALAHLAETEERMGNSAEGRALASSLLGDLRDHVESLRASAPRLARAGARDGLERLFDTHLLERDEADLTPELFATVESLRHASVASPEVALAIAQRPELVRRQREVATLRARIQDRVIMGPRGDGDLAEWSTELHRLTRDRDRLEGDLRAELDRELGPARKVDARTVAAALSNGELAISFLRHRRRAWSETEAGAADGLLAWSVDSDGTVVRHDLGAAPVLEDRVLAWRSAIGEPLRSRGVGVRPLDPGSRSATEIGEELRGALLDPILQSSENVRALYVVADDFLHLVPLEALPLDGGELGDRFVVRNEVSFGRLLHDAPETVGEPDLLLVGSIDYDAGEEDGPRAPRGWNADAFEPLPATALEIAAISGLFEQTFDREPVVLSGAAAAKPAVVEAAPSARYLHLATHGWFAPDAFRTLTGTPPAGSRRSLVARARRDVLGFAPEALCGLALAGGGRGPDALGRVRGILTAEELSALDLTGCELAVLSACETNVGVRRAGQGIQSLQAALHGAGVRTAITSLWRVDDDATRALMERFYAYLWVEELSKGEALWRAKRDLRDAGRPLRDWAAWILTGDPD